MFKGEGKQGHPDDFFLFFFFSTEHSTVSEIKVNSSAINLCHNSSRSLCLSTKQEA